MSKLSSEAFWLFDFFSFLWAWLRAWWGGGSSSEPNTHASSNGGSVMETPSLHVFNIVPEHRSFFSAWGLEEASYPLETLLQQYRERRETVDARWMALTLPEWGVPSSVQSFWGDLSEMARVEHVRSILLEHHRQSFWPIPESLSVSPWTHRDDAGALSLKPWVTLHRALEDLRRVGGALQAYRPSVGRVLVWMPGLSVRYKPSEAASVLGIPREAMHPYDFMVQLKGTLYEQLMGGLKQRLSGSAEASDGALHLSSAQTLCEELVVHLGGAWALSDALMGGWGALSDEITAFKEELTHFQSLWEASPWPDLSAEAEARAKASEDGQEAPKAQGSSFALNDVAASACSSSELAEQLGVFEASWQEAWSSGASSSALVSVGCASTESSLPEVASVRLSDRIPPQEYFQTLSSLEKGLLALFGVGADLLQDEKACVAQVNRRFRELSKVFHPDKAVWLNHSVLREVTGLKDETQALAYAAQWSVLLGKAREMVFSVFKLFHEGDSSSLEHIEAQTEALRRLELMLLRQCRTILLEMSRKMKDFLRKAVPNALEHANHLVALYDSDDRRGQILLQNQEMLTQLQASSAAQEAQMAQTDAILSEQEAQLAQLQASSAAQEAQMAQTDAILSEQEVQIAQNGQSLERLRASSKAQETQIAQLQASSAAQEAQLAQNGQALARLSVRMGVSEPVSPFQASATADHGQGVEIQDSDRVGSLLKNNDVALTDLKGQVALLMERLRQRGHVFPDLIGAGSTVGGSPGVGVETTASSSVSSIALSASLPAVAESTALIQSAQTSVLSQGVVQEAGATCPPEATSVSEVEEVPEDVPMEVFPEIGANPTAEVLAEAPGVNISETPDLPFSSDIQQPEEAQCLPEEISPSHPSSSSEISGADEDASSASQEHASEVQGLEKPQTPDAESMLVRVSEPRVPDIHEAEEAGVPLRAVRTDLELQPLRLPPALGAPRSPQGMCRAAWDRISASWLSAWLRCADRQSIVAEWHVFRSSYYVKSGRELRDTIWASKQKQEQMFASMPDDEPLSDASSVDMLEDDPASQEFLKNIRQMLEYLAKVPLKTSHSVPPNPSGVPGTLFSASGIHAAHQVGTSAQPLASATAQSSSSNGGSCEDAEKSSAERMEERLAPAY